MLKRTAVILAVVCLALFSISCSKDSLTQKPLKEDIRGISSLDKVVLYQTETNTKLSFTADTDWKILGCPAWLTISKLNGKLGTTILTFSAQSNLTGKERSATLQFVDSDDANSVLSTLDVSQIAVLFDLDVKNQNLDYHWSAHRVSNTQLQGAKTIKVTSNIFWRFEEKNLDGVSTNLVTLTKPDGENTTELQVVPTIPNFVQDTTVVITMYPMQKVNGHEGGLKPIEGLAPISFQLSQNHLFFLSSWSQATGMDGDAAYFSEMGPHASSYQSVTTDQTTAVVEVNSAEPWVVVECPEWLELSVGGNKLNVLDSAHPVSAGATQMSVRILGANPAKNSLRSGSIRIAPHHKDAIDAAGNYIVSRELLASQAPFIFEVTTQDNQLGFEFKNDAPGDKDLAGNSYSDDESFTIHVKTSGTINDSELVNMPAWLGFSTPVLEESGANWNRYKLVFSLSAQNLEFSKVATSGVAPVYVQPSTNLSQNQGAPLENHRASLYFSQEAFDFGFNMSNAQTLNGVNYRMNDLPPALTAEKLMTRFNKLFSASISSLSGEWELGPGTSDWLRVYLQDQLNTWTGEGISRGNKGSNITLFFAPWTANQNMEATAREGKLQVVSSRHLAKYGSYNNVPASAKREWTIIQRKFNYTVIPQGKSVDQIAFDAAPAYSSHFADETVVLNVTCDGRWEIRQSELPEFLIVDNVASLSADGEDGEYTVSFHLRHNPTANIKNGAISVYCLDRNNQKKSCAITQDAFVFDLSQQATSISGIPAYVQPGSNYDVQFHLTDGAKFTVDETNCSWAGYLAGQSSSSGAGKNANTKLYFHPDTHTDLNANRSGYVRVRITEPSDLPNPYVDINLQQNKYLFNLSQTSDFQFTELDKSVKSFEITSSGPWTLVPNLSWIHLNKTSGVGSESPVQIQMTVDENTSLSERNDGQIVLTGTELPGGSKTRSAGVRQEAFLWEVTDASSTPFDHTFEPLEERTVVLSVKSSGAWSITGIPSWVTVSPTSGNGNEDGSLQTVTVKSQKNLSTNAASRAQTTVKIVSAKVSSNANLQKEMKVMQKPFVWDVSGAGSLAWNSPLSTEAKSVTVRSSGDWLIVGDNQQAYDNSGHWNWSDLQGNGNNNSITVSAPVNNSFNDVSATYYIVSRLHKEAGLSTQCRAKVDCSHAKYILNVSQDALSFAPWNTSNESEKQTKTVNVTCNGSWEAVSDNDWIGISRQSNQITVAADNYNGSTARVTGKVIVRSTDTGINLYREVAVDQSAFIFKTAVDGDSQQTIHTIGIDGPGINIDCSASFTIAEKPDFVSSASITNGGKTLYFKVPSNPNDTPRSGNIVLQSHGRELIIALNQRPYLFSVQGLDSDINLSPKADETVKEVTVKSNVYWELKLPSWMQIISGSSTGSPDNTNSPTSFNLQIRAKSNNTTQTPNTGTLSLENIMQKPALSRQVRQEGFPVGVTSLDAFTPYDGDAMSRSYSLASTASWSLKSKPDWIALNQTSGGAGTSALSLTASNYTNVSQSRTGVVKLALDAYPNAECILNVSQNAFIWSVNPASLSFAAQSASSIAVSVNSPASSTVSTDKDWIHLSKTSLSAGTQTVSVSVDGNVGAERTGTVSFVTAGGNMKTVSVTQDAFAWNVTPTSGTFTAQNPADVKFYVTSSAAVTVSGTAAWLHFDTSVAAGNNNEVKVSADNYTGRADRTATLTFSTIGGHSSTVSITQKAFEWNITGPDNLSLTADETKTQQWTVNCSSDWSYQVTGNPEMLTASKPNSTTFQIQVKANTATSPRSATITLSSTVGDHSQVITVNQAGKSQPTE